MSDDSSDPSIPLSLPSTCRPFLISYVSNVLKNYTNSREREKFLFALPSSGLGECGVKTTVAGCIKFSGIVVFSTYVYKSFFSAYRRRAEGGINESVTSVNTKGFSGVRERRSGYFTLTEND